MDYRAGSCTLEGELLLRDFKSVSTRERYTLNTRPILSLAFYTILKKTPTKENISELLRGNKLILKPLLKIDKVIEHLTSNKNNIEVVNLSSTDLDQMLLSGKGTKDSSRVQ